MYPSKDYSPADLSLFRLTAKVLFLLSAFTAKTVNDLVLFSVDSSLCHVTDECIVLQTQFGSKTDRPGHRFLPVTLRKCEEEGLCPVSLQRANGAFTPSQRHSAAVHLAVHPPTVPPPAVHPPTVHSPAVHPPTVHSPAVHPPTREAGYTETVDGESDTGSRSDCISSFNEGHGDQHTPNIAFRHLPPKSTRFGYATEGALFISAQLSTDAVSALRKVRVLI